MHHRIDLKKRPSGHRKKSVNYVPLYISCPSTLFKSDSPRTTLSPLELRFEQRRPLLTNPAMQWAAVSTHSWLSKEPPQKMPLWRVDCNPTCHGQSWILVTLPPTIRLDGNLGLPNLTKVRDYMSFVTENFKLNYSILLLTVLKPKPSF